MAIVGIAMQPAFMDTKSYQLSCYRAGRICTPFCCIAQQLKVLLHLRLRHRTCNSVIYMSTAQQQPA